MLQSTPGNQDKIVSKKHSKKEEVRKLKLDTRGDFKSAIEFALEDYEDIKLNLDLDYLDYLDLDTDDETFYRPRPIRIKRKPEPPKVFLSFPSSKILLVDNLEETYAYPKGHPSNDPSSSLLLKKVKLGDHLSIQYLFENVLKCDSDIPFKAIRLDSSEGIRPLQLTFQNEDDAKVVMKAFRKAVTRDGNHHGDSKSAKGDGHLNQDQDNHLQNLRVPPIRFYAPTGLTLYIHNLEKETFSSSAEERKKQDRDNILKYFKDILKVDIVHSFQSVRVRRDGNMIDPVKLSFESADDCKKVLEAYEKVNGQ